MTQYITIQTVSKNRAYDNHEDQGNKDAIEVACRDVAIDINENIDIRALSQEYNVSTDYIPAYLSPAIKHLGKNLQYTVTILEKRPKSPGIFFLKADLIKVFTGKYHDAFIFHGANYTISKNWISTIRYVGKRRDPCGNLSVYKRVGARDSIAEVLMYITTYPGDISYAQIIKDQKQIGDIIWKDVWGNHSRMKNIGKIIVKEAKDKGGNMIEWMLNNKGGEDRSEETTAEKISRDIVNNFKYGITWKTNISLDHFLVDYDMMEFLTKTAGYTSWNDFTDSQKQVCYKNHPNKDLPDWTKLVKESYNSGS